MMTYESNYNANRGLNLILYLALLILSILRSGVIKSRKCADTDATALF